MMAKSRQKDNSDRKTIFRLILLINFSNILIHLCTYEREAAYIYCNLSPEDKNDSIVEISTVNSEIFARTLFSRNFIL